MKQEIYNNRMHQNGVYTVSEAAAAAAGEGEAGGKADSPQTAVDLDEALDIVGLGRCNLSYCLLFAGFLIASILETVGYAYVLPAARCDLDISDSQRGLIASLPYIALVITSHMWGYLADTRGRKPVLLLTTGCLATLGSLAALMPDIISYSLCKFIASLFIACPAGISYAYIGEILPRRFRDTAMSITNASMIFGSAALPLLAWLVLSWDFRVDFGIYYFRPWRVLSIFYTFPLLVCGLCLLWCPESPKYLLAQGRLEEALDVLRNMYAANKGASPEDFPVKALIGPPPINLKSGDKKESLLDSLKKQTFPLFRDPYLKWMVLNSFLLFGIFSTLNGLFMWVPDVLNRVLSGSSGEGLTACQVIKARLNATVVDLGCDDTIDISTFQINSVANISAAVISLLAGISVQIVGKKNMLLAVYVITGACCVAINFTTQTMLFAVLLSSIQLTAIGIGPINAYSVQIFPTELRGMAVGLTMMFGRTGSILGSNVAGVLINAACETTFFSFGGLLLVCALFSLLLPSAQQ